MPLTLLTPMATMDNNNNCFHFLSPQKSTKKSFFTLLSLLFIFLLAYNVFAIFSAQVPFLSLAPPGPTSFLPEGVAGESKRWPSALRVMYSAAKEESTPSIAKTHLPILEESQKLLVSMTDDSSPSIAKTHFPILQKPQNLVVAMADSSIRMPTRAKKRKSILKLLRFRARADPFPSRVKQFLSGNSSNTSCTVRFFMTWISSAESFGDRELFAIESLFNSHPNGCLIIVSNAMDSGKGIRILSPFLKKGFRVTAISPDYDYLFKHTMAETWFNQLKRGNIDTGMVSIGQNLSNLIRLSLLYKFGGVYIDTDIIIMKSFAKLRNSIGAQTVDNETKNWSRLNNAVMIFDKGHPLLYEFIEEFALTFNGNKWGHNGPYLVSRVVSRTTESNFTVLPPMAFYPVDWSRIGGLFHGPRNQTHSKWLRAKLRQLRGQSYAVHLWNRQSKRLEIEQGSIIGYIMAAVCVFCNSSAYHSVSIE